MKKIFVFGILSISAFFASIAFAESTCVNCGQQQSSQSRPVGLTLYGAGDSLGTAYAYGEGDKVRNESLVVSDTLRTATGQVERDLSGNCGGSCGTNKIKLGIETTQRTAGLSASASEGSGPRTSTAEVGTQSRFIETIGGMFRPVVQPQ